MLWKTQHKFAFRDVRSQFLAVVYTFLARRKTKNRKKMKPKSNKSISRGGSSQLRKKQNQYQGNANKYIENCAMSRMIG